MLRSAPARKASTCLRCHLRLVLRQISQRRYQSTESDASPLPEPLARGYQSTHGDDHSTVYRTIHPRGRVHGKKGSQRRLEQAEPLEIKSLGQSSEVIVLRDINESKPTKDTPVQNEDEKAEQLQESREASSLTAKEIQSLAGGRAIQPPDAEVYQSIESLKPEFESFVLSKVEFDTKARTLTKGYNIEQLRGYLYDRLKDQNVSSTSVASRSKPPKPEINEISVTRGDLQDLKQSPWHPGTTSVDVRLPPGRGIKRQVQMGRQMGRKQIIVEAILRDAWNVLVEEEEAQLGETEFVLTPMQFGLLLTKNSNTLRPLLESSKFYTKSRFQLYQPDRVIRIIGPRAEAEAISSVLRDAFSPARSAVIELGPLNQDDSTSFEDVFDSRRLDEIMGLTRTYIRYDAEAQRIDIASFVDVAINDAHRLLMALLPLPSRNKTKVLYEDLTKDQCQMETALSTRSLPFRARYKDLGRWVTPSLKFNKSNAELDDATASEADAHSYVPSESDPPSEPSKLAEPSKAVEPLDLKDSVIRQAFQYLKYCTNRYSGRHDPTKKFYWKGFITRDLWRVKIGQLLHIPSSSGYPGSAGSSVALDTGPSVPHFLPQTPDMFTLFSNAKPSKSVGNSGTRSLAGETSSKTEFVAHLIPSPLEAGGVLASTAFPNVQIRFEIHNRMFRSDKAGPSRPLAVKLDDTREVSFKDMSAIIDHDTVNLSLPSHAVDLQFEKLHRLGARGAEDDVDVQAFTRAVQHSMLNDSSLRAPPALKLMLPKWVFQSKALEEQPDALKDAAKKLYGSVYHTGDKLPVKYLFTGFSHVEKRYLNLKELPGYQVRIETIEGGVTGGRRVELSMQKQWGEGEVAFKEDVEGLLQASVDLVNLLDKIQRGEVKRPVPRSVAMEYTELRRAQAAQKPLFRSLLSKT